MRRLALLIFLLSPSLAAADETCLIASDHPLMDSTSWYGIYTDDRKVGHLVETLEQGEFDGEPVIEAGYEISIATEDADQTFGEFRLFEAKPPHRLIAGVVEILGLEVTYLQEDGDLFIEREDGTLDRLSDVDHTLCDQESIVAFQFLGTDPKIGSKVETMDFDAAEQTRTSVTFELRDAHEYTHMGVPSSRQTVTTTYLVDGRSEIFNAIYSDGKVVNFFFGPFEARWETEALALAPNESVDLFAELVKPLNKPLADLDEIEALTFKVSIDHDSASIEDVIADAFLQRVEVLDDKTALVTIADSPAPANDQPEGFYLRSTSAHPADHPRVQALLDEALSSVPDHDDPHAVAEALVRFVDVYIDDVPNELYGHNSSSVLQILDQREGDCTEHTQLFVSLARAAGIPAREAIGFVYTGDDERPALGGHVWAEIELDGRWIGVDPTWNEVELNRSHIQTTTSLQPGVTFEVVDITYR